MQGSDHHGLKRLNQPINQANPPKTYQFKKKRKKIVSVALRKSPQKAICFQDMSVKILY